MTTPDPHLTSAREVLRRSRDDMRAAIEGLSAEALNWRPADGANSISVLAVHSLAAAHKWLAVAVGEPVPPEGRDTEFDATARDAGQLLGHVDDAFKTCLSLVSKDRSVDWSALRTANVSDSERQVLAAWALFHAIEHLREHVGHIGLTRQLWDERASHRD